MIFGKKQRYIEVFQCSGEDMNLVLTGGAVSPVAKALLSPGMLSSPPPPSTPAPLTPATPMPPPAAAHPHSPPYDPLVAAAMQAQAIAQIRQSQESAWLINQLAAAQAQQQQQQQQALALAALSKQHQPWAQEYMATMPPPSMVVSTGAPTSVTSKPHMTFPASQYFPQVAPAPYFFLNLPPRMPPPAYYPKMQAAPQISPYAPYSPLTIMPPTPAGAVPSAAPQSMVNLKRSWEQAFPAVSAAEATANAAKRQFAAAVSTAPAASAAAAYTSAAPLPPPPPSPQLAYQPTQFYASL